MSKEQHAKPGLAAYSVRYRAGGIWVVIAPNGGVTGDQFATKEQAMSRAVELQAKADLAKRKGPRACMTCGDEFLSEGVHNRMCSHCRAYGQDALGLSNPFSFGAANGRRRA